MAMYLLQAENLAGVSIIVILIFGLVAILIQVLIIRWIFKIDTQLNNQKAMIFLLIKLCEKQGVTADEIDKIARVFGVKEYTKPKPRIEPPFTPEQTISKG
jgi:hypothetical protein